MEACTKSGGTPTAHNVTAAVELHLRNREIEGAKHKYGHVDTTRALESAVERVILRRPVEHRAAVAKALISDGLTLLVEGSLPFLHENGQRPMTDAERAEDANREKLIKLRWEEVADLLNVLREKVELLTGGIPAPPTRTSK